MPALLIGSMIPDWPLYLTAWPSYDTTHSFTGVLIACMPLGTAVTLLFLGWLARPLYDLMPAGLRSRFPTPDADLKSQNAAAIAMLALAVSVGALTHVVWDAFTHGRAWGVQAVPALSEVWVSTGGIQLPGYSVLQHGCSLIGLPLLAILVARWYARAQPQPQPQPTPAPGLTAGIRSVWAVAIPGVPLAVFLGHLLTVDEPGFRALMRGAFYGVTRGGMVMTLLVLLYALYYHSRRRSERAVDGAV